MTASKLGRRGYRGYAGGEHRLVVPPPFWRATTVQTCGLYPYSSGAGTTVIGAPMGPRLDSVQRTTVCCDPVSWYQRARLIPNPSEFVLSLPGEGKSTVVRRQCICLHGMGVQPLVFGDLKPDYVNLINAIGGQVIGLGPGRGSMNLLDPGNARAAAQRLIGSARAEVMADFVARRKEAVVGAITIRRQFAPTDRERTILDRALRILDDKHRRRKLAPVLGDLLQLIQEGHPDVRAVAVDRGDRNRYQQITEDLEATLIGLVSDSVLGPLFGRQTSTRLSLDGPACYDLSSVDQSQPELQAMLLMACWSEGFGAINVHNALADAGLEAQRNFFAVLDELWRVLRSGTGMVDVVDVLTRVNRNEGVGQAMITHTMSDLELALPADTAKARGLVERAGLVLCGGLPPAEIEKLRGVTSFTRAEEQMITGWSDPPPLDPDTGRLADRPGVGKFMIKVGQTLGIPFQLQLTEVERRLAVHDTEKRWHGTSRIKAAA